MKQNIFNEDDPSKKCKSYPTIEFETYNECDESFMRKTLENHYPPNFYPLWATDNISLVSSSIILNNRSYVDFADGTELSDCPLPCKTTTFVSSHIATEPSSFNKSSIEITFGNTVMASITDFKKFTAVDFLASFGGSLGLWLGMGAVQALEVAWNLIMSWKRG